MIKKRIRPITMEGMNLQKHREETGMSQQEVASALNIAVATLSRWERGIVNPHPLTLNSLLEFYTKHKKQPENKEEVIDQEFIKRHTKNGKFLHVSKSREEHDKVVTEYNKSFTPNDRLNIAQFLREQYYLIKGIKHEPMDKTKFKIIHKYETPH